MQALQILVCFPLLGTAFARDAAASKGSHPDIFLVTIDTLRADPVHCYGYEHVETSALDALAKGGVHFAQAFTASPITNPFDPPRRSP